MPPAKRVTAVVNIQLEAGQANMGEAAQALGSHGVNRFGWPCLAVLVSLILATPSRWQSTTS